MKKLILFAAVLVSLSFAACSNKANTEAVEVENTAEATEEAVVEEDAVADDDSSEEAVVEEIEAEN